MKVNLLLLFFFENWPAYMVTFFQTACRGNPTITFSLLTNLNFSHPSWSTAMYDMPVPPNVVLVQTSYNELIDRLNDNDRLELGFEVKAAVPYKLSEFAPAYGKLYEELLEGYTHWGYMGTDVFAGDILDVYEPDYRGEEIMHYEKRLYFNSLTMLKNTPLGRTMYKLVGRGQLHRTFHDSPSHTIGFDEEVITCPLMFNSNVTARWYPAMCGADFWWYQGKFFDVNQKCVMYHYGGGNNRRAVSHRRMAIVNGLKPYFEKEYYLNESIGFGVRGGVWHYYTVNRDASLEILHHTPSTVPAKGKEEINVTSEMLHGFSSLFQIGYVKLYPQATDPSDVPASVSSTLKAFRRRYPHVGQSEARVGSLTDLSPLPYLGRKCRDRFGKKA